ncbi:ATPase [Achromobacter sp. HZ28]|nr:ATPase [Achromobacter sp. HZ34]OWT79556.1 ATPase [Achromobacter sp. HZ28]
MTTDLQACDQEPIRIPGHIQPQGFLLSIDRKTTELLRISANVGQFADVDPQALLGRKLESTALLTPALLQAVLARESSPQTPRTHGIAKLKAGKFLVISHVSGGERVIEFEYVDPAFDGSLDLLYPDMRAAIEALQADRTPAALYQSAARIIRALTGYDRALVYAFDEQWNGTVVGEDRNERLPSYFDLRFPASDIPAQARELYRMNRLRLIADADYVPVPILEREGTSLGPLDLSFAVLRSVSPVHLEYMRNMGTPSSFSVSIVVGGQLWGLISTHHAEPRIVPQHVRAACDFLTQIMAMQIEGQTRSSHAAERVERQALQARLLAYMAREENFVKGLVKHPEDFLPLVDAQGAAVMLNGVCYTVGDTPDEDGVGSIVTWLAEQHGDQDVYSTDSLAEAMPGGARFEHDGEAAAGLLAVQISQIHRSYVLWFRHELVRTVRWGGDPRQAKQPGVGRLHPRLSFESWQETVRDRSAPWTAPQLDTAALLRNAIIGIVMRKAEELADITDELKRSNRELEAFSYSVSHDLRAPFRHIVGYAELLKDELQATGDAAPDNATGGRSLRYIDTIIESAHTAGKLVDGLLSFSQAGRMSLAREDVDVDRMVELCRHLLQPELRGRKVEFDVGPLGRVSADPTMLRQVFQNLLSNAIKYTNGRDVAKIKITATRSPAATVFMVQDNGVGFDMAYVGKLFGVFQRLHRMEDFEGTGIGLANVRRIAERHGGSAWAEGVVDEGAKFYFSIPNRETAENVGA